MLIFKKVSQRTKDFRVMEDGKEVGYLSDDVYMPHGWDPVECPADHMRQILAFLDKESE